MKKERVFRMKRFSVCHQVSANKVGVDGVLVGAWARWGDSQDAGTSGPSRAGEGNEVASPSRILDAGCGCGLIALMAAQRWENAVIVGIDVEPGAVEEARQNVLQSPWRDRISIILRDFTEMQGERFDMILSNPPFFNSGVNAGESARMLARHADSLSPDVLLKESRSMLTEIGKLIFIAPADQEKHLKEIGEKSGLYLTGLTRVRGNSKVKPKRILMEWMVSEHDSVKNGEPTADELIIETEPGEYSSEYHVLCKDFYLKF